VYPATFGGKVVGVMVMSSGILLLSLPVGVVGSKFQAAYNNLDRQNPNLMFYKRVRKRCEEHRRLESNRNSAYAKAKSENFKQVPLDELAKFDGRLACYKQHQKEKLLYIRNLRRIAEKCALFTLKKKNLNYTKKKNWAEIEQRCRAACHARMERRETRLLNSFKKGSIHVIVIVEQLQKR